MGKACFRSDYVIKPSDYRPVIKSNDYIRTSVGTIQAYAEHGLALTQTSPRSTGSSVVPRANTFTAKKKTQEYTDTAKKKSLELLSMW